MWAWPGLSSLRLHNELDLLQKHAFEPGWTLKKDSQTGPPSPSPSYQARASKLEAHLVPALHNFLPRPSCCSFSSARLLTLAHFLWRQTGLNPISLLCRKTLYDRLDVSRTTTYREPWPQLLIFRILGKRGKFWGKSREEVGFRKKKCSVTSTLFAASFAQSCTALIIRF